MTDERHPESRFFYGYQLHEYDPRDDNFQVQLAGVVPLPSKSNNEKLYCPVKNQGGQNSCVGHVGGLQVRMEMKAKGYDLKTYPEADASEAALYVQTRMLEGTYPKDGGVIPNDMYKIMLKQGIVPAMLWPYNPADPNSKPIDATINGPNLAESIASAFQKISAFYNQRDIGSMRLELSQGYAVGVGIPVYPSFERTFSNDVNLPQPGEPILGYHDICLIDYDDFHDNLNGTQGAFYLQNSWGTDWGQNGRAWIPYNFFTSTLPGKPQAIIGNTIRLNVTTLKGRDTMPEQTSTSEPTPSTPDIRPLYKTKTFWLNIIAGALAVLSATNFEGIVPTSWLPYITFTTVILNVANRLITDGKVTVTGK